MKVFIGIVFGFIFGSVFGVCMSYTPSNIKYYIESNPAMCIEQWESFAC